MLLRLYYIASTFSIGNVPRYALLRDTIESQLRVMLHATPTEIM